MLKLSELNSGGNDCNVLLKKFVRETFYDGNFMLLKMLTIQWSIVKSFMNKDDKKM